MVNKIKPTLNGPTPMNEVYDDKGRVVSLDIPLHFAQCTYVIVYGRHYRSIDLNVSSAWVIFSATHVVRDETWFYLISSFPACLNYI